MSFLSAAFLLALPLVLAPIAIHLYRGRQRDVVLWGAMQFLAAAVTKGRRMERLEELLLMLLRFAAVAVLVLALAQPMVRSSWLGNDTERDVILVLDNSLSMSRQVAGQSAIDAMKKEALELVDSLSSTEGVQLLTAVGNEWATASTVVADSSGKRQLREIIDHLEPTEGSANLLKSLEEAIHLQSDEQLSARRIVVLTDSQASSWQADAAGLWNKLAADCSSAPFPITISAIACGLDATMIDNLSVNQVQCASHLIRPGEQVEVTAEIENTGSQPSQPTQVKWLVGDKAIEDSAVVALAPHAKTSVKATLKLDEPGTFVLSCRVEKADEVPLDQENSLIVEVADQLPILFVQSSNHAKPGVSAAALFAAALGFKDKSAQPWHSIFRPEVVQPAELATRPLTSCRAIVVNNPAELGGVAIERLDAFVRAGGGLWLALGDQIERKEFNRDWYGDGEGLSPVELGVLEVVDKANETAATIHPPSRDHQATMQLANTTQLDIDEARVEQRWQFIEPKSADKTVSVLMQSGNGRPLVVEKFVGQGRVIVQSFPLDLTWSNMPLLKAYVVMIQDWLDYITAPQMAHYNLSPGAQIVAAPPNSEGEFTSVLVTPQGREVPLANLDSGIGLGVRYSQTQLPGTYRLRFTRNGTTATELPFHVERDPKESDVRPLTDPDREKLLAAVGVQFGRDVAPVPNANQIAPRREPIWGALLTALIALLAAELLMSNWLGRQRAGLSLTPSI